MDDNSIEQFALVCQQLSGFAFPCALFPLHLSLCNCVIKGPPFSCRIPASGSSVPWKM